MPAILLEQQSNCELKVSNLKTEGCAGVLAFSPYGNSTYEFRNNEINCAPGQFWPAFTLGEAPVDKVIMLNNTIHAPAPGSPLGAIYSENINDGVVAKTTITGDGLAAIALGMFGEHVTNWHLLGNNVETFNAWYGKPIVLETGTSDCTVVGGLGYNAYVYDNGTNNEIIELEEDALEEYIEDFLDGL